MEQGLLLDDLRQQIANGQAVVIVGAGVAIGATNNKACASWKGLLLDGVERCVAVAPLPLGWAERVRAEIESGDLDDLLSAAEKITQKLGGKNGPEYSRWLRETVGALRVEHYDVIDALHGLGVMLATTNYDGLLEEGKGVQPVTWREQTAVMRVLRGADPGIVHLHGHWRQPESVIFGIRSYEEVLGDAHAQAILYALQTLKTLIFIGYGEGLSDPNFSQLLEWTAQVFAGDEYRRFRLCLDAEVETLRQQHPPAQRLFPIGFGPNHADLVSFLRSLGSRRVPSLSPPSTETATQNAASLPVVSYCFGRDMEREDLIATLLMDNPPPTPILGPPGIGKSTLSLVALHDSAVVRHYGARRYYVRCEAARSRTDLAMAIARALQLQPSPTLESAVLTALATAPTVLVLDNAETPWEADTLAVEEFLGLLASVQGLGLVASVRGNQRPLGVRWRDPFRLSALQYNDARQAFLAIAGQQFDTDPHLDDLVAAVDGVPLAITLLAHMADSEPNLAALWRRWQQERTAMLQRADGKDRLTNLELSYELSFTSHRITPTARRLLSVLALLTDGLAWGDLAVVLPMHGEAAATALRQAGLVFDQAARLRVLAPLREYVQRQYPPTTDDGERLVQHFVGLAAIHGNTVGATGGAAAVQRLLPDTANIEAMLVRGLTGDQPTVTISATIAWGEFVRLTGVGSGHPIEQAAAVARNTEDWRSAAACVHKLGDIALARSDYTEARQHYETALPLYQRVGSVQGEASCIENLGNIARRRSDHTEARQRYEAALPLYQQVGSIMGEANCIKGLGDIALRRSDLTEARQRYETALPLFQQVGSILGKANCIYGLGDVARTSSKHAEARQCYEAALPLYQRVGSVQGEANCIKGLGNIALARSDYTEAQQRCEAALPLYQRVGDVQGEASCIESLGDIALWRSEHENARQRYEAALPLYQRVGDVLSEANCIKRLGDIALERSEYQEARQRYEAALLLYQRVGSVLGEANCIQDLGDIALAHSKHQEAHKAFEAALTLYTRIPEPHSIGQTHRRLARLSPDGAARMRHVQAARAAWECIDRPDLLAELEREFGT